MGNAAFEWVRSDEVPSLNIVLEEYRHRVTRARHFHLASDDSNNAFLVAFLTVPQDSTGVAHILEHTSLCGSRRFPVRDPFFMMIRRSLNTFMNAFTASDWTAYPFASQNRKDFDNLLEVYLDAAFFPRLERLDFAQEGHRIELSDPEEPSSDLVYKGVVYNEMKGAMSPPVSQVAQKLQSLLFPSITYHHNSGGDPAAIPDLTHDQLAAFHARHYHPSNAVFMTYGNFPVAEHQAKIHDHALRHFEYHQTDLEIPDEERWRESRSVSDRYTFDGDEETSRKTHVILTWLLGKSFDLRETMDARVLAGVLLNNSSSPLRHALETTDLGTAPSELCGLDDSTREATFACGLEGTDPEQVEAIEKLVLDVLTKVAEEGVPREHVDAVLHQVELAQREIGGGHFPYGLQLMVRALSTVLHGGEPHAVFDLDPVLEELRERVESPDYIKALCRDLLLDNPHRLRLTMTPDRGLSEERARAEQARLGTIRDGMNAEDLARLMAEAEALKERQETEDDPEVLPRVGLADVPAELDIPESIPEEVEGTPTSWFTPGTNGLVYEQIVVELPDLEAELVDALPLFCDCATEVGAGDRDYLAMQAWQAAVSGGIGARTSVRPSVGDIQRVRGVLVFSGKALARNQDQLAELLLETFARARFDEHERLRELVAQVRAHSEAQVTGHGHVLAMSAASAGMGPCGALAHGWDGLLGLQRLKALDDTLDDPSRLAAFGRHLERIRDALLESPRQMLVVAEETHRPAIRDTLARTWRSLGARTEGGARFEPGPTDHTVAEAWSTNTQVNFCAKAYPTVPQDHPDAPALQVLGPFLRNGFLHRAIREQGGAYGGGAGYNPDTGSFRFFSYRDPRLAETLADFDGALEWLRGETHEPRRLEEAILGVISEIDRPSSPAGEAIGTFFGSLHERTPEQRRRFRQAVLGVTLEDLRRVTDDYLRPGRAGVAVVSDQQTLENHPELGLELNVL